MKMKNKEIRYEWILDYIKKTPTQTVNIFDSEFVDAYIAAFKPEYHMNGRYAFRCRQLTKDLKAMYDNYILDRETFGLEADSMVCPPKWIYIYSPR